MYYMNYHMCNYNYVLMQSQMFRRNMSTFLPSYMLHYYNYEMHFLLFHILICRRLYHMCNYKYDLMMIQMFHHNMSTFLPLYMLHYYNYEMHFLLLHMYYMKYHMCNYSYVLMQSHLLYHIHTYKS